MFVITCDPFMHIGCNTGDSMVHTTGYPWLCHCEAYLGSLRLATVQPRNTPILTPESSDFDSLSMSQIHNPPVCDLGTHTNHCLGNTADNHDPRAPIPWLRHCMAYPGTLRLATVQPQYTPFLTPHLSIFDPYLMSWISDFMIWTSNSGLVDLYPGVWSSSSGWAPYPECTDTPYAQAGTTVRIPRTGGSGIPAGRHLMVGFSLCWFRDTGI